MCTTYYEGTKMITSSYFKKYVAELYQDNEL